MAEPPCGSQSCKDLACVCWVVQLECNEQMLLNEQVGVLSKYLLIDLSA